MLDETALETLVEGIGRRLVRRSTLYKFADDGLVTQP
jgi:hypothetical protein